MAIKSVTQNNLADYVAAKRAGGAVIATAEQAVQAEAKVVETKAAEGTPIVGTVTETVSNAPDPGNQVPPKKAEAPKSSVQERINELTREKKELEEFAESEYEARQQAQRRIAELESQVGSVKPTVSEDLRPDRSKYKAEEADKYENELLAWNRRTAIREFQDQENRRRADEALKERTERARAEIEDFDAVIQSASRRQNDVPPHVVAAIVESDVGPHLAYHLAKNPTEAQRIFALTPARALLALGKIESSISVTPKAADANGTTPTITPVTKLPTPTPSLTSGAADVTPDFAKMEFKDYKRRRIDEIRKARR